MLKPNPKLAHAKFSEDEESPCTESPVAQVGPVKFNWDDDSFRPGKRSRPTSLDTSPASPNITLIEPTDKFVKKRQKRTPLKGQKVIDHVAALRSPLEKPMTALLSCLKANVASSDFDDDEEEDEPPRDPDNPWTVFHKESVFTSPEDHELKQQCLKGFDVEELWAEGASGFAEGFETTERQLCEAVKETFPTLNLLKTCEYSPVDSFKTYRSPQDTKRVGRVEPRSALSEFTEAAVQQSPEYLPGECEEETFSIADFFTVASLFAGSNKSCLKFLISRKQTSGLVTPPAEKQYYNPPVLTFEEEETRTFQHPDHGIRGELIKGWRARELESYTFTASDDIDEGLRLILVSWMTEVACELKICRQTFQMALNYLDRFHAHSDAIHSELHQILAVVALYIACKKEEIEIQPIQRFMGLAFIAELSLAQFHAIEIRMLELLEWKLSPVTYFEWISVFLRRAALQDPLFQPSPEEQKDDSIREDLFGQISYILDIWMHTKFSVLYPPSLASASAFYLVLTDKAPSIRRDVIAACTGYHFTEMEECISTIRFRIVDHLADYPAATWSGEYEEGAKLIYIQPEYPNLVDHLNQKQC